MIQISKQFNGPPGSGNGGYVAGAIADFLSPGATNDWIEISLKAPPPLDSDITTELLADGRAVFKEGDTIIVTAKMISGNDLNAPKPDYRVALGEPGMLDLGFNNCFVCGTKRKKGDGLCIHTRPRLDNSDIWQAPFDVDAAFCDAEGTLYRRFIFAALDCPGYAATSKGDLAVLARFKVKATSALKAGERATIVAWPLRVDGRKRQAGTALYNEAGERVAEAEALWIAIDPTKLRGA